jgi:hypothetical protein
MRRLKLLVPIIFSIVLLPPLIAQEFRITNDTNFDEWPEVDPFTKEIYYVGSNPWSRGIFKILLHGGIPELTSFFNIPTFFKNEHKAAFLSEVDSLVLFDFDINANTNLIEINNVSNFWISISPEEKKLFHFEKAPSYYSLIDSTYYTLPFPPFAPEGYPFSRIQWKDEYNIIFLQDDYPFDTSIVNYNYFTNQLDTIFQLDRINSEIWSIAYNPVYNLLAYSFITPMYSTYVSLIDLYTMQDTLILPNDTTQQYFSLDISEMVWTDSGRKLGIIGNHLTVDLGELFLFDYINKKMDTLTVYPANNDGRKTGLRWFGEDTLIYSKFVYEIGQWQIFGFNTNYMSNINHTNHNPILNFQVQQNYPNPFNGSTTIPYNILIPCYIQLIIYDLLGREIKSFTEQNPQIGFNSFLWDGKNSILEEVSSGIYFYRIRYDVQDKTEYSSCNKMILLK